MSTSWFVAQVAAIDECPNSSLAPKVPATALVRPAPGCARGGQRVAANTERARLSDQT